MVCSVCPSPLASYIGLAVCPRVSRFFFYPSLAITSSTPSSSTRPAYGERVHPLLGSSCPTFIRLHYFVCLPSRRGHWDRQCSPKSPVSAGSRFVLFVCATGPSIYMLNIHVAIRGSSHRGSISQSSTLPDVRSQQHLPAEYVRRPASHEPTIKLPPDTTTHSRRRPRTHEYYTLADDRLQTLAS